MKLFIRLTALAIVAFSMTFAFATLSQYESLKTNVQHHEAIPTYVKEELLF